jgi:hypothetical protein
MADDSNQIDDLIETTLDNYLLALAQGIQEAQRQLDQSEVPGRPGQPAVGYHLPRVEFELKMTFAMRGAPGGPSDAGKPPTSRTLMLAPAARAGAGETYSGEATSTIRGAFVAVPITGVRAATVLRCSLVRRAPLEIGLVARVTDALGAPQAGVAVQANVDRERSAELSDGAAPSPKTELTAGLVRTDDAGYAETTLRIDPDELAEAVVVVVDAPGATETLMIQVPRGQV